MQRVQPTRKFSIFHLLHYFGQLSGLPLAVGAFRGGSINPMGKYFDAPGILA